MLNVFVVEQERAVDRIVGRDAHSPRQQDEVARLAQR
jgi:hypothetical protein